MIRKLDLYMLRELIVPFLIGTLAVTMMFQANMLIGLYKNLNLQIVPPQSTAQLILLRTPEYLSMTLPVGTALATSMAFSRLTRETELTAMRSAGVSIFRILLPIAIAGIVIALANFVIVERVMPPAERSAKKLLNDVGTLAGAPTIMSNINVRLRNSIVNVGLVERGPSGIVNLTDILVIERPQSDEFTLIIARNGSYSEGKWLLKQAIGCRFRAGVMDTFVPEKDITIDERIALDNFFVQSTPEEMSLAELSKNISEAKKMQKNTTLQEIKYHTRFSIPASCFIFAIVGPIFAVRFARRGAFTGVLLSILLVLAYYNGHVISTEILGRNGYVPPVLSAWIPNIIFGLIGLIALRRAE